MFLNLKLLTNFGILISSTGPEDLHIQPTFITHRLGGPEGRGSVESPGWNGKLSISVMIVIARRLSRSEWVIDWGQRYVDTIMWTIRDLSINCPHLETALSTQDIHWVRERAQLLFLFISLFSGSPGPFWVLFGTVVWWPGPWCLSHSFSSFTTPAYPVIDLTVHVLLEN